MSGTIDFLLDTNYVLALVKRDPALIAEQERLVSSVGAYAVSVITRIELLGYPDLTGEEENELNRFFEGALRIPLNDSIENRTINIRRARRMKIPDAVILATALEFEAELLTLDDRLRTAFQELRQAKQS